MEREERTGRSPGLDQPGKGNETVYLYKHKRASDNEGTDPLLSPVPYVAVNAHLLLSCSCVYIFIYLFISNGHSLK